MFVMHGGINVFSRTIVYLRCTTNNQASTVMASLLMLSVSIVYLNRLDRIEEEKTWQYGNTC